MSRTYRSINRNSFGWEYKQLESLVANYPGDLYYSRKLATFGTDTCNDGYKTREFFNRAHRLGRADARAQLRPQRVLSEDYDFNPSRYKAKYKAVWWDIF